MGVYIKGVAKPKSCKECFIGRRFMCEHAETFDDCPIVEIKDTDRIVGINGMENDLINRQAAMMEARPEYLNPQQEKLSSYNQGWNNALDEYFDRIKALPSADAVEVVRCRDCKFYDRNFEYCHNVVFGDGHANYSPPCVNDDDYCSFGVRREDGEE